MENMEKLQNGSPNQCQLTHIVVAPLVDVRQNIGL